MTKITTNEAFRESLSSLTLAQQRVVSARFIGSVLDLTRDNRIKRIQAMLSNTDVSAEDLDEAYHSVHSIYVHTSPRSHFSLLDYNKQAEHFVAEACMYSLAPTYFETKKYLLAARVAMCCLMARTCASINHEGNYPKFTETEDLVRKEVDTQYKILSEFLESI